MNPVTPFTTVCLAGAVFFGVLGLRASPTSSYETVDLVRVRTRTALLSCAVILLVGALYAWFFIGR
jgi:hypothetical protein